MEKLALFGGSKAITLDYQKVGTHPWVNKKELESSVQLLEKGEISVSQTVYDFEAKFAGRGRGP